MTSGNLYYVVCLIYLGRKYFMLWRAGEHERDAYVAVPGTPRFVMTRTRNGLLDAARTLGLAVSDHEPAVMNLDNALRALAALQPERPVSQKNCESIYDGWNSLEDMAWAISLDLEPYSAAALPALQQVHDKLFYGLNLPSMTPPNRRYSPIFSSDERDVLSGHLHPLWREIRETCGQFPA